MRPGPFDRATVIYSTVWHPSIIEVVPKSSTDFPRKLRSRDRIRSPMVGKACARIRQSPSCPPLGRHDIDHRCLKIWLGSNRQGKQYRGYLDSGREESPHKLKAVLLPLQTFVSTRQNIHILLLLDNSSAIAHKTFQSPVKFGSRDLGVVFDSLDNNSCGVYNTVADAESRRAK